MTTTLLSEAIASWKASAKIVVEVRAAYVRAYAVALAKSDAKNAEGRKADADVGALSERMTLEFAEIEERSCRWQVSALVPSYARDAEAIAA